MKKQVLFSALAVIVIVSLVLAGCSSAASPTPAKTTSAAPPPTTTQAASNVIKLKYGDQNPDTGWEGSQAAKPWLEQITKATNGRVQFETYYAQSLFKGTDAWVSVKNGVGDLAWMFHGYWANQTPLADVLTLPFLPFTSAKQASGIFWQLYEKYPTLKDQFKDNHVLVTWTSQPYFLITSKKQVKVPDDIKGLQIRVPGGPPTDIMKALGAVPVSKGMPDTYLALQKGEIDGMAGPWEAILSFKLNDVVKYYTYMPLFTVYFTQAMNNDKWNSIPKDVQDQIMSVSGLKGSTFWGENMFDTAVAAGRDLVKKTGTEMNEYTVTGAELDQWVKATKPVWDTWLKKMSDAGHPEAQDILNTTLDLIKNYKP
jgi:TRAP-type C4-dicarboxylate transport system substrate-binding protein